MMTDLELKEMNDTFWKEETIRRKEETKLKNSYKKQLNGLVNVAGLFRFLDDHDSWHPIGIVEITLVDEKDRWYPDHQCARLENDESRLLYTRMSADEIRGVDHWFVKQWCEFEDSYHGYLLLPLKDGRYFHVSYAC